MNPRVSRSSRARVEGHRIPHREDRREARRGLHARRAAERHHAHERRLRAGHRLRRRQVAALRVREVPRRRDDARHADEERRRGDEHRPHVLRGAAEGGALARDGLATASVVSARTGRLPRCSPRPSKAARSRHGGARASSAPSRSPRPTPEELVAALAQARRHAHRRPPLLRRRRDAPRRDATRSSARSRRSTRGFSRQIRRIVDAERAPSEADDALAPGRSPRATSASASRDRADRRRSHGGSRGRRPAPRACARPSAPSTRASTPARPSSSRARRTSTRRTRRQRRVGADAASRKVVILGGGPNRIGQGIEFDYCCVHAVQALRELGFETVMVNCNPETVSTDYDTSDRLYFEPLTLEDVLSVCDEEKPDGVIVQFGGQTPLKLALAARAARHPPPRDERGRHRPRRRPRPLRRAAHQARAQAPAQRRSRRAPTRRSPSPTASATRCSSGRATCSAGAR